MSGLKEIISKKLKKASQDCYLRGLFQASSWAAEQLLGIEDIDAIKKDILPDDDEDDYLLDLFDDNIKVGSKEINRILLGSSLIAAGDYLRCSSYCHPSKGISSDIGLFLYAYSTFLSGERKKAQLKSESNKKNELKHKSQQVENTYTSHLELLYQELNQFYKTRKFDGYLLYIFAVILRDYRDQVGNSFHESFTQYPQKDSDQNEILDPYNLFMQSLALNPWNWCCWLEFSKYCLEKNKKIPTWDEISLSIQFYCEPDKENKQYGRAMFAFFMAHVYLERHRGDLALQAMEKLYKVFPSSLHLLTHVGVAYYAQRLYDRAEECFEVVRTRDAYRLQHIDTYSNILFVKEKSTELSLLAHSLVEIEKFSPEVCCVVGNYYSLKGNHERAVLYFQRAIRLDSSYLSAWTLMGHEYMELHNTSAAVQCYRKAVETSDGDYRAWYGLGQTYEMLHLYHYANYYYQKAASLRPTDARMWCAVGNSFLKLGLNSEAIANYERAVNSGDREGIATRDLARLYKEDNQKEKAAQLYYKYLLCNLFDGQINEDSGEDIPVFPESLELFTSVLHEMAEDPIGFEDSRFQTSEFIDSEQADALIYLASYFQIVKDYKVSEFFCLRLLSFSGPEGDEARLILKDLRSKNYQQQMMNLSQNSEVSFVDPLSTSQSKALSTSVSPLFSPWKRLTHQDHEHEESEEFNHSEAKPIRSSNRNTRRESMGSQRDAYETLLRNDTSTLNDSINASTSIIRTQQGRIQNRLFADDSRMSIDSTHFPDSKAL